jgi:hypothetical protein
MKTYLVTWQIDIEADSPEEAAAQALIIQRDTESTASVFEVLETDDLIGHAPVTIDLDGFGGIERCA